MIIFLACGRRVQRIAEQVLFNLRFPYAFGLLLLLKLEGISRRDRRPALERAVTRLRRTMLNADDSGGALGHSAKSARWR